MVVTSYSRFLTSGVSDTSESLGRFAESTLLSRDMVSDDLSWSSSDLIIRLQISMREDFLADYEGDAQLLVHHIRTTSFAGPCRLAHSFKPALNHSAAVSQSRRIKISPFQTGTQLICRRPYCDSVETDDIDESLPRGSATMYDTSVNTAMSV